MNLSETLTPVAVGVVQERLVQKLVSSESQNQYAGPSGKAMSTD